MVTLGSIYTTIMKSYLKQLTAVGDYVLLILITAIGIWFIVRQGEGMFVYSLDDAYIHLAIGKNIASHGIWGVTPHEHSFASSSPLWSVLLSITYFITGSFYLYIPLILNLISCLGILSLVSVITRATNTSERISLITRISIILCLPFFPLIVGGMENMLFSFFVLLFTYIVFIKKDSSFLFLGIVSVFMVSTRYEGTFVIASATLLLLFDKKWKHCFVIVLSGILPILLFGIYFISLGGDFFPNSVLIKGNIEGGAYGIIKMTLYNMKSLLMDLSPIPFIYTLLSFITIFMWLRYRNTLSFRLFFLAFATFSLHLLLAQIGWMFRYEAYLLVISTTAIAVSFKEIRTICSTYMTIPVRFISAIILAFSLFGLGNRVYEGHSLPVQFSSEIFLQQIQVANFVKKYFPNNAIALNDIGAVCYFTNIHCTDVYGLATTDIARAKRKRTYTPSMMEDICNKRNTEIAIVYPQWLRSGFMFGTNVKGDMPKQWKKAGALILGYKDYVIGSDTVNFYAVKPSYYDTLRIALQNNKSSMSFSTTSRLIVE